MRTRKGTFSPHHSQNFSPLRSPPLRSPENPHIDKSIHASHTNFPTSVVAIIGILTATVFLLGYYIFVIKLSLKVPMIDILVRFTFSRGRRIDHPSIHSQSAESPGLDEALIRSIPVFIFKKRDLKDGLEMTYLKCSVCLNEFQENEKLRCLPNCAHFFHIDCIDVWLQENANCPLCKNSITIAATPRYPMNQAMILHGTSLHDSGNNFPGRGEDVGTKQELFRIEERLNSRHLSVQVSIRPSPKKLQKKGEKCNLVSSMGDECIDIKRKAEQFYVQPIRRSISMDSAADRQHYLSVQHILQHQKQQSDACLFEGSSNRVKRSLCCFGHGIGSNRVVLPLTS